MSEHLAPDQVSTNEITLICVKLLGLHWKYIAHAGLCAWANDKGEVFSINRFDTWSEAGLILDALAARGFSYDLSHTQTENGLMQFGVIVWFPGKRYTVDADSLLIAIRAAAVEYVRGLK